MTISLPVELPDSLPACHALIRRPAEVLEELTARIERLNRDLAALKRHVFGSRRERFVAGAVDEQDQEEAAIELPLVELMRQGVMQSRVQGIDETRRPMLCPELGHTPSARRSTPIPDDSEGKSAPKWGICQVHPRKKPGE